MREAGGGGGAGGNFCMECLSDGFLRRSLEGFFGGFGPKPQNPKP